MEGRKHLNEGSSFAVSEEFLVVSAGNSNVSVAEEPLQLAVEETATLKSCILASEGKASDQEVKKTKRGHSRKLDGSKAKGAKRKLLETREHNVEIRHYTGGATDERFAEEVAGSGRAANDMRIDDYGEGGSGSWKRIKLKSSIISRTDRSGSVGRRSEQDGKRNDFPKGRNVQTGLKNDRSVKPTEGRRSRPSALNDEVKQKWETQERWKRKTHVYLGSDFDRSRMAQSTRDRDGESRNDGQRSKGRPEGESSGLVRRTRSDLRQFTGIIQKNRNPLFIRDGAFGRSDLKRSRDHDSRSVDDSKKRRDVPKRSREEVERVREHGVKLPARDSKLLVEDHDVTRGDKRVPRDRLERFSAGEVQEEVLEVDRSTSQVFRDEKRNQGNSRRPSRDLRQNRESENRNKVGQHGENALTKHRGSRNVQFHHLSRSIDRPQSRNEGVFKGNVEHRDHLGAHIHRQNKRGPAYGSDGRYSREDQGVQRDAYRPDKRVENDNNFVRNPRRADKTGMKERFVQTLRGIDERSDLFRRSPEDRKSGKENVDHASREIRGTDRLGSTDIKDTRHKTASQTRETNGGEGGNSRRCSSKVVAPSQPDGQDVGVTIQQYDVKVTNACDDGEKQELGFQENGGVDHKKRTEIIKNVQPVKSILQEDAGGASEGTRQMVVEINHGQDIVRKDTFHQNKGDPLVPESLKDADKRKRRNHSGSFEGSEELKAEGAPLTERSTIREVREGKRSLEKRGREEFKRQGAAKEKVYTEGDVKERTEDRAPRKSLEGLQLKAVKVMREKDEKSNESLLRRQAKDVNRDKQDVSSSEHTHQKHHGSSHSVSPHRQKRLLLPKEHGKSTSPHRSGKDRTDWDKFERERINTLPSFDSRYRRFGGGTSGLGGYSPRRRRSEAAIKTPSPPPRSPERKKLPTWDSIPPGMDSSMIAAISAAHHAAVQHALVTLATVAPLVPGSMLVSPVATPTSVSSGLTTVPSMIPSLLPQMNPAVTAVTLTQATRPLRRLYVGNVPTTVSDGELLEFMNAAMLSANANHLPGTKPCINCSVNVEKSHAFAEFITPEDATAALAFDGVTLHGTTLKIRRPKDFVLPSALARAVLSERSKGCFVQNVGIENGSAVLDMVSSTVADSPDKVFVGGIPSSLTADKVKEIVTAFGQLKAYHWEVDYKTQPPQAFAFLEYMDPAATLNACAGLNGMRLGSGFLTVVQATPDADPEITSCNTPFYGIPEHAKTLLESPSRVLELHNLVSAEEVLNLSKEDAEELIEDVRLECTRFGSVKSTHMVQPWSQPEIEIENTELGKIEGVAVRIIRGVNLDYGSMSESVQEEVTEDDTEEELPLEQLGILNEMSSSSEQKEILNEMSSSPIAGQVSGSFDANEKQILATDVAADLSLDQFRKCNDRCDIHTNESSTVDTGITTLPPAFGKVSMDTSGSETIVPSDGHELLDVLEQDTDGGVGLSTDSLTEEANVSTREWDASHVGNVYVEFTREDAACQAAHALHGRFFGGHKVAAYYFPLKLYQKKFHKGLGPRTFKEKQALALAVQGHLTAHIKD